MHLPMPLVLLTSAVQTEALSYQPTQSVVEALQVSMHTWDRLLPGWAEMPAGSTSESEQQKDSLFDEDLIMMNYSAKGAIAQPAAPLGRSKETQYSVESGTEDARDRLIMTLQRVLHKISNYN